MNIKKVVNRLYKLDDAELITISKAKVAFMRRDLAELAQFGITAVELDALDAQIDDFEAFPTDIELEGEQMDVTERKNAKANAIKEAIAPIMLRVQNKFGHGSARYKSFATKNLVNRDDANLHIGSLRVVKRATLYLADLSAQGLTVAELDALTVLCEEFKLLLIDHNNKIADRSIAQEDRVLMGNALFDQLKKYCRSAKSQWFSKSEARFNDYIIYKTPSGKHEDEASEVEE